MNNGQTGEALGNLEIDPGNDNPQRLNPEKENGDGQEKDCET